MVTISELEARLGQDSARSPGRRLCSLHYRGLYDYHPVARPVQVDERRPPPSGSAAPTPPRRQRA
jgi:hypothetical protein